MHAWLLLGTPLLVLPVVLLLGSLGCAVGVPNDPVKWADSIFLVYDFGDASTVHKLNATVWAKKAGFIDGPYVKSWTGAKITKGKLVFTAASGSFHISESYGCMVEFWDDAGHHGLPQILDAHFTSLPPQFELKKETGSGKLVLIAVGAV